MNNIEAAYILGCQSALEKTSSANILRIGKNALQMAKGYGLQGRHAAKTLTNKYAPGLLTSQTRGARFVRGVGRELKNPFVHVGGVSSALSTDGSFGDKAKAYATGGLSWGAGWRLSQHAARATAAKLMNPATGSKAMRGLQSKLTTAGMDSKNATRAAFNKTRAMTKLKSGDLKGYDKYMSNYKDMLKKDLSFGQRLKFNLANNKANMGLSAAGFGGGYYLSERLSDSANTMLGINDTQLQRKAMERQQPVPQMPMRNQTLMAGNNPYSNPYS
jgi:hypothetical protein